MTTFAKQLLAIVFAGAFMLSALTNLVVAQTQPISDKNQEIITDKFILSLKSSKESIYTNDESSFELELFKRNNSTDAADFSHVWVKLSKEDKTYFHSHIFHTSIGGSVFNYKFLEPGEYQLETAYYLQRDLLTSGKFTIIVTNHPDQFYLNQQKNIIFLVVSATGCLLLVLITIAITRWFSVKNSVTQPIISGGYRTKRKTKKSSEAVHQ